MISIDTRFYDDNSNGLFLLFIFIILFNCPDIFMVYSQTVFIYL